MTDTDWATLAHRLADMARNGATSTWRDDVRDAVAAHHDCCCTDLWPELRDEP